MFIYLASPYFHPSKNTREQRYEAVMEYTAFCLNERIPIYSPIVYCHPLAKRHSLPKSAEFWNWYNKSMMRQAFAMRVLKLDGWEDSVGVRGEIEMAEELGIPITYVEEP
jgi:hypothetical protein